MPFTVGTGRKASNEWTEVVRVEGSKKVLCKYCTKDLTARIERIRAHMMKCCKRNAAFDSLAADLFDAELANPDVIPTPDVTLLKPVVDVVLSESCPSSSLSSLCVAVMPPVAAASSWAQSCSTSDYAEGVPLAKKARSDTLSSTGEPGGSHELASLEQGTISQETDALNIDTYIAKFFYSNGLPFGAAESKAYERMMKVLRPGYSPPFERDLTGHLLDKVHCEIKNKLNKELKNATITLKQIGWSSMSDAARIATAFFTGSRTFLLNTMDCRVELKTANFFVEVAKAAVKEFQEKYDKEVFAFCTDNVQVKKCKILVQNEFSNILVFSSSAHCLCLLESEVPILKILRHIFEVHKYFRNTPQTPVWFREKGCSMQEIPKVSCSNAEEACIVDTFNANFNKYIEAMSECSADQTISALLNEVVLFPEEPHFQTQLKEFSIALDKLCNGCANLSTAVEVWQDLYFSNELILYHDVIEHQLNDAMEPFFYVANLMDPLVMGSRLTDQQEKLAESWIMTYKPEFLPGFLGFRIKDADMFPASMFEESVLNIYNTNISKWWLLMESRTSKRRLLPDGFCKFFTQLFCCPPSAASVEEVLFSHERVLSNSPNGLKAQNRSKFVEIQGFLLGNENDSSDSDTV